MILRSMKVIHLLGIAGVESHENPTAKLWGMRLEWPLLLVALWIPIQWYLEEAQLIAPLLARIADWMIWLAFFIETTLLSLLVKNKRQYLVHNWMNLAIIIGGMPIVWQYTSLVGLMRSMRLMLVVVLLARPSK